MNSVHWLVACVVAGSLAGGPAWGQPAAPAPAPNAALPPLPGDASGGPTLRIAVEAAWQRAVIARESDDHRRRAEADRAAAGRLWSAPPALELSHRNDRLQGNTGGRETEIGVVMPLWLPGQRAARAGIAEAAVAQARAAELVARLRLAGEVREAAWQLTAARAEAKLTEDHARVLRRLADDVDRRVRAGDLARADALAAEAEHLAARAQQAEVHQRLQAARARWTLLTGLTATPELTLSASAQATVGAPATHPELLLAEQATELARRRVELMRRSRRDAPELTVGLRQDVAGRDRASEGSLFVGLRLPFGTDDRNQPLEAAALGEFDVAQTHEQRLRERLDIDLRAARDARRAAQEQLDAEAARAGLLRERAGLLDTAFRAGETPLPDLLRALAAATQADGAVARQTAALGLARARLDQTLGLLP